MLTSTHNLCFGTKIVLEQKHKKNVFPFIPKFHYIRLWLKWVAIHYTATFIPDGWFTMYMIFKPLYEEHDINFNNIEYCIDACVGVEALILETCQISVILCDNTSSKCKCPNAAIMSARLFTNEFKLKINAIKP